jgi:hypothetical protein
MNEAVRKSVKNALNVVDVSKQLLETILNAVQNCCAENEINLIDTL